MRVCDCCGGKATARFFVPATLGPCGDSFCYASCDLAACRGATYDTCGHRDCNRKLKRQDPSDTQDSLPGDGMT